MPGAAGAAPAAGVAGLDRVKASAFAIEQGANLSDVLTHLVNEVSGFGHRAAMFIVKGPNAIGWYAKGFESSDAVKQVSRGAVHDPGDLDVRAEDVPQEPRERDRRHDIADASQANDGDVLRPAERGRDRLDAAAPLSPHFSARHANGSR